MKAVATLIVLALSLANAMPELGKPPNCPALLAAAQQQIAAAEANLTAAKLNLNTTEQTLDQEIAAATTAHNDANSADVQATNVYNQAVNSQRAAQNALNLDTNKLNAIKTTCSQPVHPPTCGQLISDAQALVASATTTLAQASAAVQQTYQQKLVADGALVTATTALQNANDHKAAEVKILVAQLNAAIAGTRQATINYETIAAECQLTQVRAGKPPNCPQLLANAMKAIAAAEANLTAAKLDLNKTETQDDDAIANATANLNAATSNDIAVTNTYNEALNAEKSATDTLQKDQNKLTAIQTTCKQPVHPPTCPSLIQSAQEDVATATQNLAQAQQGVAGAKSAKDAADAKLATATAALNQSNQQKIADVQRLVTALNNAIANTRTATMNYQEISAECQ